MVVAGAGVVGALAVGAIWVAGRGGGGSELSPAQVVSAFFQAQGDGDCRRLVDLVSEASWSGDGERSRDEFLDECDAALDGYRPRVARLDLRRVGGDRVTVSGADAARYPDGEWPEGTLVRERGRWRVRLDDSVLHLGRSVPETVRSYVEAYDQANCGRLAGLVSESVWSAGAGSRAELIRRYEQDADRHRSLGPQPALAAGVDMTDVTHVSDDRAEAALTVGLGGRPILGAAGGPETVRLVRDGLRWLVAGSADLPDGWVGAPLRAVVYADLEARLADEVVTGSACSAYADGVDRGGPGDVAGEVVRIARSFPSCDVEVSVHRLADGEGARRAVRSLADAAVTAPVRTGLPNQSVAVPGVPDALGVRMGCDVDGCSAASAYAARGPVVVVVVVSEGGDIAAAGGVLAAQLGRL